MFGLNLIELEKPELQKIKEERDYWVGARLFVFAICCATIIASIYLWFSAIWGWAVIVSLSTIALVVSIVRITQMIKELENRIHWFRKLDIGTNVGYKNLSKLYERLCEEKRIMQQEGNAYLKRKEYKEKMMR